MGWLDALIPAVVTLYGAKKASDANKEAANTVSTAQNRATDAITAGNAAAEARLAKLEAQGQPGMDYLRSLVVADPSQLTPQQQLQLEDARRATVNQLATSGLRGSGRATTAAIRKVEEGVRGNMIAQNRGRSDSAASTLAGMARSAATGGATIDMNTGQAVGNAIQDAGNTTANADLSNANLNASTMGSIASIFANNARDAERDRRYAAVTGAV